MSGAIFQPIDHPDHTDAISLLLRSSDDGDKIGGEKLGDKLGDTLSILQKETDLTLPLKRSQGDGKTRNPLQCPLCNEPYDEPCILSCFHSFCERCLRGRAVENKMVCPVCG